MVKSNTLLKLWFMFFIYTSFISILIQFVLLPYVFPQWHAGNGLLNSLLDSISFHKIAVDLTQKIHLYGWSAWQLRPDGQAPAGIAAIVYALTAPRPWTLIPINAFLHATSAILLLSIIQFFIPNLCLAIICVLPFLLYPSAMSWYTQIHKDGYSILGMLLVIYGWLILSQLKDNTYSFKKLWIVVISITSGFFFSWIVRPYLVQNIIAISLPISFIVFFKFLFRFINKKISFLNLVFRVVTICLIFIIASFFIKEKISISMPKFNFKKIESVMLNQELSDYSSDKSKIKNIQFPPSKKNSFQKLQNGLVIIKKLFQGFLNNQIKKVAYIRGGYRTAGLNSKSNIDANIGFKNVRDIFVYLPRAFHIVFFTPFPQHWFRQGSFEANTLMRRISAFEMIGIYFALIFLPFALWHWRKRIEIWIIFIFCSTMMLIWGLVVCNIGTLYRVRYGYIMTLVALGIAGFITLLERVKLKQKTKGNTF